MPSISTVTLVVPSYAAGIAFYVGKLGFDLTADKPLDSEGKKRWVSVRPPLPPSPTLSTDPSSLTTSTSVSATSPSSSSRGAQLLLAQASTPSQTAAIGNQTGGRVGFFLETDDFWRDYELYRRRGVSFLEEPRTEAYGVVVQFEDDWRNRWDLIQYSKE